MRRILLVLMIIAVALLIVPILPATAHSQEATHSTVYFPMDMGGFILVLAVPHSSLTLQVRATALLSKSESLLTFCAMFLPLSHSYTRGING